MDHTRGLIAVVESEPATQSSDCPDCGAPRSDLPPVEVFCLRMPLLRCHRCGRRHTYEPEPRELRICSGCRLPCLGADTEDGTELCDGCRSGEAALASHDPLLAAATEGEVTRALGERLELVGSTRTSEYLARLLREVAARVESAATGGRVVLVDETAVQSLALPSGTVLLSVGAVGAIEDEAELAFVLGHELAHVGSGDVATALVRLGLRGVAADRESPDRAWPAAAQDLIRLGYGDTREHAADRVALAAMVSLDYDPQAALRYLERIRERTGRGDPDVAELALAHPPPAQRRLRLEKERGLVLRTSAEVRVDREVFRRAMGHSVLAKELAPVRPFDAAAGGGSVVARLIGSPLFWTAAGLLLVALVVLLAIV